MSNPLNAAVWLALIGGVTAVLVPGPSSASWSVANPTGKVQTAKSYASDGGGPDNETKDVKVFRWNGSSYGSWGFANPDTVTPDVGFWETTLHPEVGISEFPIGDYKVGVGWPTIEAQSLFEVVH
jgi:hypothetical protein